MDVIEKMDKYIKDVNQKIAGIDEKIGAIDLKAVAENKEAVEQQKAALEEQKEELTSIRKSLEDFTRQMPANNSHDDLLGKADATGVFESQKMARDFGLFNLAKFHPSPDVRERCAKKFCEQGYKIRNSKDGAQVDSEKFIKAVSSTSDVTGGFLSPDVFLPTLIRNVNRFGVIRQWLMPVPMGAERVNIPKRTGGLKLYYPDMGKPPTESDLRFGTVALTAKKWAMLAFVDEEMDEDAAIDIGNLVMLEMAHTLAIGEDTNGFLGDGTPDFGNVTGIFNSANVAVVTMDPGDTTLDALDDDYLGKLKRAVPAWARRAPDAAWYCSSDISGVLEDMKDLQGRPLYPQHPTEEFQLRIKGKPVREAEVLPESADVQPGDKFLAFGSLRLWGALGTRRAFAIKRSTEVRFLEGQITLLGSLRQDIQETSGEAMAVLRTSAV